jgi:exopolyphosphatase/guanosine-5'-triphosphate,3'-diphosphate pyrophosphatase
MTRLARGMGKTGRRSETSTEDSLVVLREFAEAIKRSRARRSRVVGTSVLREAENPSDFVSRARSILGMDIEIISGEEESRLSAVGVTAELTGYRGALLFDFGEGSTEMVFIKNNELLTSRTLRAGTVKLTEEHIHSDPPSSGELEALEKEALETARLLCGEFASSSEDIPVLIGTGGTVTTLASMDMSLEYYDRNGLRLHEMSRRKLREILKKTCFKNLAPRETYRRTRAGPCRLDSGRSNLYN